MKNLKAGKINLTPLYFIALLTGILFLYNSEETDNNKIMAEGKYMNNSENLQTATFGSGCFWCTEAIFEKLEGVESVVSGYSGGSVENPTYNQVTTGKTGHAEVTQIKFNPDIISYEELLEVFWKTHDPTTLNRQGADVGTQYRSAVFYHNEKQKELAEKYKNKLEEAGIFKDPIVTEVTKFDKFYAAEDYHQNYYEANKNQPYCAFVITPKLEKFQEVFSDKIK